MDEVIKLIDSRTKENVNYELTTLWWDGSVMTSDKKDNTVYREKDGLFYRLVGAEKELRTSLVVTDSNQFSRACYIATMIKDIKTIIIDKNYNLNGSTILIPENCTLQFKAGSLTNGTLFGDNSKIESDYDPFENITLTGDWIELTPYLFYNDNFFDTI